MYSKLTIYFDGQFWVGLFEMTTGEGYSVAKYVFGPEPTDREVYLFILRRYPKCLKFSRPIHNVPKEKKPVNSKRLIRLAKKELSRPIGTRSQQALKIQREMMKKERKSVSKQKKEEIAQEKWEIKQKKRREKHKGH